MDSSITLSTAQQFELERFNRVIDETTDREALRKIAKQLHHAWQTQRAATVWAYRQTLPPPFHLKHDSITSGTSEGVPSADGATFGDHGL